MHQPNGLPVEDFTVFGDPQDPAIRRLAGYGTTYLSPSVAAQTSFSFMLLLLNVQSV